MASDSEVSCINDPNFAVICSFLNIFSKLCAISPPNVYELQEYVENTQEVLEPLKELHLKLLRRAFKSVRPDRWEKSLIKFCHQQLYHQEAWELERFGYKKASTHIKLKVLKVLLEYQFTCNTRFKTLANQIESTNLRQNPVGRDKQGCLYWLHVDHDANLRLYKEDQDEETWNLIASDRDGLVKVISMLKSGEDIHDETLDTINEDSNSIEPPTIEQNNSERSKLESNIDESDQLNESLEKSDGLIGNLVKNSLNNRESHMVVNDDGSVDKKPSQEDNEKGSSDDSDGDSSLLPSKRIKSESIKDHARSENIVSISEEIEEPVLYISGEGTGNECESNAIYFSEEIVEPILYVRGHGEGFACDTGNTRETGVENDNSAKDNETSKINQKHSSGSKSHIILTNSNGGTELNQLNTEEATEGVQDSSCSPINLSVGDSDANRERNSDNEQNRNSDSAPLPVTKRFLQKIPKISLKNISEHASTSQKPVLWSINTLCSNTDDKVVENTVKSRSDEILKEKEEKRDMEFSLPQGIFNNIADKKNCGKQTPSNFLFGHPGCLKLSLSKPVTNTSDANESTNYEKVPVGNKEVLVCENEIKTDKLNLNKDTESGYTTVKLSMENKMSDKEEILDDNDTEVTKHKECNQIKDNSNCSSNGVLKKDKIQSDTERESKLHGKHKVEDVNKTMVQHVKEGIPDILPSKKLKLDGAPEEVRHPLLDKNRDQNIDNEFVDSSKEPNGNIILENISGNDTEVTEENDFHLEDPLNIENCTTATEEDRDSQRISKIKEKRPYIKVKKIKAGKDCKRSNRRTINCELIKETKEELPNRPSRNASKVKLHDNKEDENLRNKKVGKKGKYKKNVESQLTSCDSKVDEAICEETKLNNVTSNRQANIKNKISKKEKVTRGKRISTEGEHVDTDEKKGEKIDNTGCDNIRKRMREMSGLLSGNDAIERGGKKLKMKPKRALLNSRKNVEEKIKQLPVSSDEDADVAQDSHTKGKGFRKTSAKKVKQEPGKNFLQKKDIKAKKLKKSLNDDGESTTNAKEVAVVDTPVRQSRRIAQIKIREEAERRQMEEVALREMKEKHKKKSTKDKGDEDWRDSSGDRASVASIAKKAKVKLKTERKQKGSWKKWGSSSGGGGSDSESEEPDYEPEEIEDCGILKSDHEFSPESDLETEGVAQEPLRRARTLKKDDEKDDVETEGACAACGGRDHPEWILLCDACDAGHHASCLKPMLWLIPDGNWYCPPCQHARLIETLENELMKYDKYAQTIDEEKNKKITELAADDQREQPEGDDDSTEKKESDKDTTSSDSKSSTEESEDEEEKVYRLRERRQLPVSYRFKEYDQLMSSAIKEEYQEKVSAAGNMGRGKDISTIIEADKEEKQKAKLQMGLGNETKEFTAEQKLQERARKAASRKKPRKLNSLEVISEDDDDNSDEDFKETGWSVSSSEASTELDEVSDTSRSSDSLPIRRSQRSTYTDRRRVVESPEREKRKKKKRIFDDTTSSESSGTRDWANRKKKKALHKARIDKPRKIRRKKMSKVLDENKKKTNPRVTYGGLSGSEESHDWSPAHRTRQKKIDYTEMPNTESEDEMHKPSGKHMPDSSDEYKVEDSDQSSDSGRERNKGKGFRVESSDEDKPPKAEVATSEDTKEKDNTPDVETTTVVKLEKLSEDVTKPKAEVSEGMQSDDPILKAESLKPGARPLRGKGSRGGRQSRGARGASGRGRGAGTGTRAADPDRTDETLINLIGVKIKDLTQDTSNNTDKLDSPEKVERERRRKEKEAKLLEKEQRKIERLKKKEEKELLKEQKAKEKEAKKLARIAFQESKKQRKSKEFAGMEGGPIPIMGVAPGLAVGHPPRGSPGRPSLSVKRGLTVRPFTDRTPGRDFGRPRMEDARTGQFLSLGPRACFPSGQGAMTPTQDQRTRPPGATGPRGEPILPADPTTCGAPSGTRLHSLPETEGRTGTSLEFRSGYTAGREPAPPAGPRLQVRPELRRMRPDLSHLQRPGFAPDHRLLELGTMPSISVIDEAKLCGREPIKKSQGEGTLSVAGSPQPFKPATDAPSVITRMPHMMSSQYRASSIYGSSTSMFGPGCGPPPHMAMYHRSRHPADGTPPPGSRAPYPGPYYSPLQMYPQRFPPSVQRPGRPQSNAETAPVEEPPKVKVEIKSEPEFSGTSPPPEETVTPRPTPVPTVTDTPRLKVKHTESKERPPARARLTAATRYPHGPYAPQYVPFGPYAPPASTSETFSPSHVPQLSRTAVEPVSVSSNQNVARSTTVVTHGTSLQSTSSTTVTALPGLVRNPNKSDASRLKESLVPMVRSPQPPTDDRQVRSCDAEQDIRSPSVISPSTVPGPTEEENGVFGGLVSYFSSQHADDIDG